MTTEHKVKYLKLDLVLCGWNSLFSLFFSSVLMMDDDAIFDDLN